MVKIKDQACRINSLVLKWHEPTVEGLVKLFAFWFLWFLFHAWLCCLASLWFYTSLSSHWFLCLVYVLLLNWCVKLNASSSFHKGVVWEDVEIQLLGILDSVQMRIKHVHNGWLELRNHPHFSCMEVCLTAISWEWLAIFWFLSLRCSTYELHMSLLVIATKLAVLAGGLKVLLIGHIIMIVNGQTLLHSPLPPLV